MIRLLALLSALLLLLCACSPGGGQEDTSGGDYLYMKLKRADSVVYLARLNLDTGNVTSVCPDPLCSHDEFKGDCPLSGVTGFFVIGDTVYMPRRRWQSGAGEWKHVFSVYDIASDRGEIRYIWPDYESNVLYEETVAGGYYYTWDYAYEEPEEMERAEAEKSVLRMALSGGAITWLGNVPLPQTFRDGRYYYVSQNGELVACDSEGGNPEPIMAGLKGADFCLDGLDAGYIHSFGIGELDRILYEAALADQSVRAVESAGSIRGTAVLGNYVYFLCMEKSPAFIGRDNYHGNEIFNHTGGKLWRMKFGGEPELYLDFGSERVLCDRGIEVCGDRLVLYYGGFAPHVNWGIEEWQEKGGGVLVIDPADDSVTDWPRTWDAPF